MDRATRPKVVVSNGFSRFHLAVAAEAIAEAGRLEFLVTGAYPKEGLRKILRRFGLSKTARVGRLVDRRISVADDRIVSLPTPELLRLLTLAAAPALRRWDDLEDRFMVAAMNRYGKLSARALARASPEARIFHYRAGFGGASVAEARARGMIALCDHSAAHPALFDHLRTHGGRLPETGTPIRVGRFWRHVAADMHRSDFVLVNSDFVKATMQAMGEDPRRIFVIYLGVDERFSRALEDGPPRRSPRMGTPCRFLFAGRFDAGKGADVLVSAIERLSDIGGWELAVAGPVAFESRATHDRLAKHPYVRRLGLLSRDDLAAAMKEADVFVFPSLAEGSARVVFEAFAAGCYVVTTENSGSIVGRGAHGTLVPPNDPDALASAMRSLVGRRDMVFDRGQENAELVRRSYGQKHYGEKLAALYDRLVSAGGASVGTGSPNPSLAGAAGRSGPTVLARRAQCCRFS